MVTKTLHNKNINDQHTTTISNSRTSSSVDTIKSGTESGTDLGVASGLQL